MTGFPTKTPDFLKGLAANNEKAWFEAHRADYLALVKAPAERICAELEAALAGVAQAPVKGKVLRIHRDIRFSKDKRPYNTWVRMSFRPDWGGAADAAWFLGLDADGLTLGAGGFDFQGAALDAFRRDVAHEKGEIGPIVDSLLAEGFRMWEPALKRVPAPWPQDHPRADLLKRKGLAMWWDTADPAAMFGPEAMARWLAVFTRLSPLNRALAEIVG